MSDCPECGMRDDDWFLCRREPCPTKLSPNGDKERIADLERQNAELREELNLSRGSVNNLLKFNKRATDQLGAAEAENARLKALPLKDEVERVVEALAGATIEHEGETLSFSDIMESAFGDDCAKEATSIVAPALARSILSRLRAREQEGWQIIGYARAIDVDTAERPFEGKTSFWVSERQTPYYSVPVYLSAAPSEHGGERGSAKEGR